MSIVESIEKELQELGYKARIFTPANHNAVVAFKYKVDTGRYSGNCYRIGISFQEEGYPEYPPHFIHVCCAPDLALTAHSSYQENEQEWKAFSVPPSDFWDRLPHENKNMKTYLNLHMRRFWDRA